MESQFNPGDFYAKYENNAIEPGREFLVRGFTWKEKYAPLAKDKGFHLVLYHIKSDLQRLYLGKKKSNHCIYLKINKSSLLSCVSLTHDPWGVFNLPDLTFTLQKPLPAWRVKAFSGYKYWLIQM